MRKIVVFNRISMDGLFAGPNGETHDWFIHDPGVDKFVHELIDPDTALFGRATYQLFEGYWPKKATDPKAAKDEKKIADELNTMTKLVASSTLKKLTWENSVLIKGDLIDEVKKIKQGGGRDIVIFGSGSIVQQLTAERLIDEYVIVITPVVLGSGKTFFHDVKKLNLKVLKVKEFDTGNVLIHFAPHKIENKISKGAPAKAEELS
jgi:dihydrofolate reductase